MSSLSNGIVLYNGASLIDGERIVVIATGLRRQSQNRKTGPMVQVFIIRADVDPVSAQRTGADYSICADCTGRRCRDGWCYVNVGQSVRSVFNGYQRGIYPAVSVDDCGALARLFNGRSVRFGAYGDPAAAPLAVWRNIAAVCSDWTGYTHAWARPHVAPYRSYLTASVDTIAQQQTAAALGWSTFRPVLPGEQSDRQRSEVLCLAESRGVSCRDCPMKCDGRGGESAPHRQRFTAITVHGASASNFKPEVDYAMVVN